MANALVTLSEKATGVVQDLIKINIDSAEGFKAAAEEIGSADIAAVFREYGAQRAANAEELKATVAYNGENPTQSGSVAGTLHRWWLEVKGKVTSGGVHAVLAEAERGEDTIKHRYEAALKEVTGTPVATTLQAQYAGVKAAHDNVRDLRDSYKSVK